MNYAPRRGPGEPAHPGRSRDGILLVLVYAKRVFLVRIVVELLLRLASMAG